MPSFDIVNQANQPLHIKLISDKVIQDDADI
jgi:hypothetical protein